MNAPSYSTSYIDGTYTPAIVASSRSTASRDGAPAALPRADHLGDLADDFFAVADDERVDVLGERLGVVRAVAAGDHDRVLRRTVLVAHGDAGEIHAGSSTFVYTSSAERLNARTSKSAAGRWVSTLNSGSPCDRSVALPCRSTARTARSATASRSLVQDLVEDLQPLVGEPDLVGVGVDQEEGNLSGRPCCGRTAPRSIPM